MHWLRTGERLPDPASESSISYHRAISGYAEPYGVEQGVNIARKHIGWYTKGLHGSAEFRNAFNKQADADRAVSMLGDFYAPYLSKAAA
jgi:tRNA-dihydrouridine synthase B